ncbi:zinc ribbon domain-containing protein [Propionibacterium sp.]|uniref:zinc ribbon domain-containing protein n=1 Tax=Propionibacterium sp. TaxID=1977903 RepID=UPI0039E89687
MHADPTAQRRLLDIAALDTKQLHLNHQAAHLPENEGLSALQKTRLGLSEKVTATETRRDDAQRLLDRAEEDLAPVKQRLERNQKRADDGVVSEQRALASLLAEIDHLKGRMEDLEEAELEAMQQVEDEGKQYDAFVAQRTDIENSMRKLLSQREDTKARITRQAEEIARQRTQVVADVPADLFKEYEKIRAQTGSTGAAGIRAKRCGGCGMEIDVADLRRFTTASPDEVLYCEECGRILVRTEQPGLS